MSRDVLQVRKWVAAGILAAVLVAGGFLGNWAMHWAGQKVYGEAKVPLNIANSPDPVRLGAFTNGFASVVQPALPAVVNIATTQVVKVHSFQGFGFFNDPFFRQFFGPQFGSPQPQTQKEHSLGSGVIVNSSGYILTNNHVVAHGTDIEVTTRDNKQYKAKVIGTDPLTDIAVLKIDAKNLPTLTLGNSSDLEVGDVVFAIGDPFGIGETATMGIVSAKGRSLGLESQIQGKQAYEDFIQTDAAINPGNSGGAMIDLHGHLVGINTAIIPSMTDTGEGGNLGIGFAIPINMARHVMEQIIEHGKVERGYLGVYIGNLTPGLAKEFGYTGGGNGALISDVQADTPAAKAGLKRGDIILGLNGQPINGAGDLTARIANTAPGTGVQLKVFRNGKTMEVPVTLGELPEKGSSFAGSGTAESGGSSKALEGVQVEDLTPTILQQLKLPVSTQGVVVDSVEPNSAAAEAGLRRGDVIQEVNHKAVNNVSEFRAALSGVGDHRVLLLVDRNGITAYILIEPGS